MSLREHACARAPIFVSECDFVSEVLEYSRFERVREVSEQSTTPLQDLVCCACVCWNGGGVT